MDRRRRWPVNRWSHGAGTLVCALALGASPGTARASECQDSLRAKDLVRIITEGDTAFSALDDETFASARREAVKSVQCLEEPLSPGQAALLHKLQALGHLSIGMMPQRLLRSTASSSHPPAMPCRIRLPRRTPAATHFAVAEGMVVVPGRPCPRRSRAVSMSTVVPPRPRPRAGHGCSSTSMIQARSLAAHSSRVVRECRSTPTRGFPSNQAHDAA